MRPEIFKVMRMIPILHDLGAAWCYAYEPLIRWHPERFSSCSAHLNYPPSLLTFRLDVIGIRPISQFWDGTRWDYLGLQCTMHAARENAGKYSNQPPLVGGASINQNRPPTRSHSNANPDKDTSLKKSINYVTEPFITGGLRWQLPTGVGNSNEIKPSPLTSDSVESYQDR